MSLIQPGKQAGLPVIHSFEHQPQLPIRTSDFEATSDAPVLDRLTFFLSFPLAFFSWDSHHFIACRGWKGAEGKTQEETRKTMWGSRHG